MNSWWLCTMNDGGRFAVMSETKPDNQQDIRTEPAEGNFFPLTIAAESWRVISGPHPEAVIQAMFNPIGLKEGRSK